MSELLPCPCGSKNIEEVPKFINVWVRCLDCTFSSKKEHWNTRADNVEQLKKELQHYKDEFVDVYNQCTVMQERIKELESADGWLSISGDEKPHHNEMIVIARLGDLPKFRIIRYFDNRFYNLIKNPTHWKRLLPKKEGE